MKIEIKETNGTITAFLNGRLDTAAATEYASKFNTLIDNAGQQIVLNCEKLDFISSMGLRLFLSVRKAALGKGGSVIISGCSQDVMQVFAITGFNALFKFE